jgi:ribosomal protein S18 acetylase RimI-like enzyme
LKHLTDSGPLRSALSTNILENAVFTYWVFESELDFDCYADDSLETAVAIEKGDEKHVIFAGKWQGITLPIDILAKDGFFVSACPPGAMDMLRRTYKILEEWPCWFYVAAKDFGTGPWDELDSLTLEEVPRIAKYWELSDDPEPHIRTRVEKFDSVCKRVNGEPVAWAGLHFEIDKVANMGFAHTLEEERRKGYATLVAKGLVNKAIRKGKIATCHVIKDNTESVSLCEHLGFIRKGEATWADVGPPLV